MEPEEIQQHQGTRLSNKSLAEQYAEEMEGPKLDPVLEEQIKRYEERAHHKASQAAEEELARQKELSNATAASYRWVTVEEYGDVAPRMGRIMHSAVLLDKLKKECGFTGWYAAHVMPGRYKLIYKKEGQEPEYVCWVQAGFTSEYTIMKFDEHDVPLDERYRGWRTVLLQTLMKGFVKEDDVLKAFGPATGPASSRYNALLYEWRNRRAKLV